MMSSHLFSQSLLPLPLYRAEQARQLDQLAIEEERVSGFELMLSAGREAFRTLLKNWPDCQSLTLFCGGGNNGGDGYIIARLAKQQNMKVELVALVDPSSLTGEAAEAFAWASEVGIAISAWTEDWQPNSVNDEHIVIDALLGTGLTGEVRSPFDQAIEKINQLPVPILAIDIPSGLCSDTGRALGCAVRASHTITFIGVKQGLLTGQGPDFTGQLSYARLDVSDAVFDQVPVNVIRADWWMLADSIPERARSAHKGQFGKVLVIGGEKGMAGAAIMAAESACRVGAGLVYLATRSEHVSASVVRCPEVMAYGVTTAEELTLLLKKADVVVIGPGLGQSDWSRMLFTAFVDFDRECALHSKKLKHCIVDADALNLVAQDNSPIMTHWIMTPHSGEAARLLKCTTTEIENDRFQALDQLERTIGGQFILKGAGTLVSARGKHQQAWLANTGNPGMASGGMGDVLAGILGGLAAQPVPENCLLPLAVTLHGEAANFAAKKTTEMSLCATDVIQSVSDLLLVTQNQTQCFQRGLNDE